VGENGGLCIIPSVIHDIPYTEINAWMVQIMNGGCEGGNLLLFFLQPEYHASGLQVNLQESGFSSPVVIGSYAPYLGSHACFSLPASWWNVKSERWTEQEVKEAVNFGWVKVCHHDR